jgi:hypothetical protein
MNLPKYVYRHNLTDKILGYEDELTEEMLAKVIKDCGSLNFMVWKLNTLGKSSWYAIKDSCKDNIKEERGSDWKCSCIKCQLKEVM